MHSHFSGYCVKMTRARDQYTYLGIGPGVSTGSYIYVGDDTDLLHWATEYGITDDEFVRDVHQAFRAERCQTEPYDPRPNNTQSGAMACAPFMPPQRNTTLTLGGCTTAPCHIWDTAGASIGSTAHYRLPTMGPTFVNGQLKSLVGILLSFFATGVPTPLLDRHFDWSTIYESF